MNRIVRYREVGGRLGERIVLLDGIPANGIHDGGRIRFGPDGLLYATAGDAANTAFSQDLGSTAGKILRLNPDGTTPRGNPFGSPIYSFGHRNPQGIDWHPATGELWGSEHGATGNDEINVIDAGANYGWPRIEGAQTMTGMRTPITFYNPSIAPSGASFYRGQVFPAFSGNLFVATLRGSHLLRLRLDGTARRIAAQERLLENEFGRIRDVISGPDGFLYFSTSNGRGATSHRRSHRADRARILNRLRAPAGLRASGSRLRALKSAMDQFGRTFRPPSVRSPEPGVRESARLASLGDVRLQRLPAAVALRPAVLTGEAAVVGEDTGGQRHLDLVGSALRAGFGRL